MTTATAGAAIRYTTDGSTPTTTSALYSSAINLTNSATVKAAAFMSGYNPSSTASAAFTITQPFDFSLSNAGNKSLVAGSFTTNSITATLLSGSAQAVTFSASGLPAGVTASFSSPSCAPTCSSTLTLNTTAGTTPAGTFPITVSAPTGNGLNRTTTFNLTVSLPTVATPTITPNGGSYTGSVLVSMATTTTGASIRYTTDGTNPTASSTLYSGAISLGTTATVKAAAFKSNYNPSGVASASFTINQPFDFSLANSGNKSVTAGASVTNSITAALISRNSQAVSFSVSGLPSGATGSFSSTSCSPTCSTDFTIITTGSTPAGNFPITVSSIGGGVTKTTAFNLTVSTMVATPTITVDSTYAGYTTAPIDDAVINAAGETVTTWVSAESTGDHWVQINLSSPQQLNTATIYWAFNSFQQKYMTSQQVQFQYWNGSSFVTAATLNYPGSDVPSSTVSFPSVTASQIRFFQPANMGNPTYSTVFWITELDYRFAAVTPPPPPPPGSVSVDSTFSGYTIAPIDDGVINAAGGTATTWASEETATDHWVNLTFSSPRQINSAIIYWAYNDDQQTYMTAQAVNIQYWNGSSYQTISTFLYPGSDVAFSFASFATVTTSQLRFLMPAGQGNPSYPSVFWITELDYGMNLVAPTVIVPAVSAPTITPNGGSFTGSVSVAMQTATSGASIRYTTDGSTPTPSSNLYTGAITLTNSAVVKSKAFKSGYSASPATSASFAADSGSKTTGNVYYVSKTGSNSNSCTQARSQSTAKLTIAAGLACMASGDTLIIGNGVYTERIDSGANYNEQLVSGTDETHRTIIKSQNPLGAILRPSTGVAQIGSVVWIWGLSYITFDGLVIDSGNIPGTTMPLFISGNAHHIRIQNSELMNSKEDQPCLAFQPASYIEVINNKIHDCGTSTGPLFGYNIYVRGDHNLIERNELYNAQGWCVHQYSNEAGSIHDNIVRYNYCHDSGQGILQGGGSNNIAHNNVVRNTSEGISVRYGGANQNRVYNNTIYGSTYCLYVKEATNTDIRNNLCLSNTNNNIIDQGTGTTAASNSLSTNTTFVVDAANNNFTPSPNSPLIDAGQIITGFSSGKYMGLAPDIGAVEAGVNTN
jgi:parallel beta-helix repeat protein